MSTRGLVTVIYNEEMKVAQYNTFDSCPWHLGVNILAFLKISDLDKFKQGLENVFFVDCKIITQEGKKRFPQFRCRTDADEVLWMILRQENLVVGQFPLENSFDVLDYDWAYEIDLDNRIFTVYKGLIKNPNFVLTYSLDRLPDNESFLKDIERGSKEFTPATQLFLIGERKMFTKEEWKDILGAIICQRNESQSLMNKMAGNGSIRAVTEYKKMYIRYNELCNKVDKIIDSLDWLE